MSRDDASAQIGAGVVAGLAVALGFEQRARRLMPGAAMGGRSHVLLPTVAAVMFTVGVLAALGPARRRLAVQPTAALRDE